MLVLFLLLPLRSLLPNFHPLYLFGLFSLFGFGIAVKGGTMILANKSLTHSGRIQVQRLAQHIKTRCAHIVLSQNFTARKLIYGVIVL